jgi:hypothetical protein
MGLACAAIGTSLTTIHTATASANTYGGLYVGNIGTADVKVDVSFTASGGLAVYLVKNVIVPYGKPPVIIAPRIALSAGDVIQALCDTASSAEAFFSYGEKAIA